MATGVYSGEVGGNGLESGLATRDTRVGEFVLGVGGVRGEGKEAEEEAGNDNEKVEAREEVGGAGGSEFCEGEEGKGELEGENSDDAGGEKQFRESLIVDGDNKENKEVKEAEDDDCGGSGDEGTKEMGGVSGERVGFLEGEGGGENDASENVKDNPEIHSVGEVEDGDGKDDGNDGEKMSWVKGSVNDDNFEEAVEEKEAEGGGERKSDDVEYLAE